MKGNAIFLALLVTVALALLVVWGGAASAAGTRTRGVVHFYEADASLAGDLGTDILTGAITDHGTDHQASPRDGINRLILEKGSFSLNVSSLGKKLVAAIRVDRQTCSLDGSATGRVRFVDGTGTGAYRGVQGTIEVPVTEAGILPRLKNGGCNTNATRYPGVLFANGSGTISYK